MVIGILGQSGYVGGQLDEAFGRAGLTTLPIRHREVDVDNSQALARSLQQLSVDFLVNAAGFTGRPNVDACEFQKMECLQGNAVLPGVVREACERIGVPFAHISSGCIYSGRRVDGAGFAEEDPPNFSFRAGRCSFYSGCKALGEEVLEGCESCYVWRLRIPFDHRDGPRNYLSKLMRYDRLLDAENSLTHLGDFARSCVACIENQLPFGIYNLTNHGSVTTREVVTMLRATIARGHDFQFFEDEDEFMREAAVAPRSNCVLDTSKAISAGLPMRPIREALQDAISHWQSESVGAEC